MARRVETDVRAGYAAWAAGYDAQDNPMIAAVERELALRPLAFEGRRVLDIGCGTGRVLARALGHGAAFVQGIDGSVEMLAEATRRLGPAIVEGQAALAYARLDGDWSAVPTDFDLATITLVLEHQERVAPVLARAARHLRPGGMLFVAEIHPDMLRTDLGGHFERDGVTFALPSHPHDRAEFEAALADAGFARAAFHEIRADADTIAAIPKFAKRAGSGVLLTLRASTSPSGGSRSSR
ncbi:MAG: class I SAM-dependent methyltransferase [Proteobacteria bacterium]|nr:class I SAM-dependent methyltransferase [Pseudomonadota bacterium]